jgi:hypothetical protein
MNDSAERNDTAIRGCVESCERMLLVANTVTPAQYRARWKDHKGIGPHLRHCYEHLAALMNGLDSGTISYDARERNVRIEQEPAALKEAMATVLSWVNALDPTRLDAPLTVCQIPRIDAPESPSTSTLQRELLFLTSHTIHHLALVSMLAELQGVSLPDDLGVAYSTTTHEHQQRGDAAPAITATT